LTEVMLYCEGSTALSSQLLIRRDTWQGRPQGVGLAVFGRRQGTRSTRLDRAIKGAPFQRDATGLASLSNASIAAAIWAMS